MKRLLIIIVSVYVFFLAEFLLFNVFGRWGKPNLLLLLVIFYNLYLGIRHGLFCAFCAGLLRDAFSSDIFGTHLFLFMMSAVLALLLRRNFYQPGSRLSRLMVSFGVVFIYVLAETIMQSQTYFIEWPEALRYVALPQIVTTMAVATFVFIRLKDIAVKINL